MGIHTLRSYYMTPLLLNPSLKIEGDFLGQHAILQSYYDHKTSHDSFNSLSLHVDKGNTKTSHSNKHVFAQNTG